MNRSYSNFIHYHAAIVGNFDTILENLGITEDVRMNITSSLSSKRYTGQLSKITEDEAKKELWSFGVDPRDLDFNDKNVFYLFFQLFEKKIFVQTGDS